MYKTCTYTSTVSRTHSIVSRTHTIVRCIRYVHIHLQEPARHATQLSFERLVTAIETCNGHRDL